jgi:PrtD family type I secretion system ABC transporter
MKSSQQPMRRQSETSSAQVSQLDLTLRATRPAVILMFVFSLVTNALRLTTPLFMIQVVDRVLSSRNTDTLINLGLIAVGAMVVSALITSALKVMQNRVGSWVESVMIEPILRAGLEGKLVDRSMGAQLTRDLGTVRAFYSAQTLSNLFDIPWLPIFLGVIFVLSPIVGAVAIGFAVVLIGLALLNHALTRDAQVRSADDIGVSSQHISRGFQSSDVLHSMGMVDNFLRTVSAKAQAARQASDTPTERAAVINAMSRGLRQVAQIAVLGVGAYLVTEGLSTTGIMMAGSSLLGLAMMPVDQASGTWRGWTSFREALARLRRQLTISDSEAQASRTHTFRPSGHLDVQQAMYLPQGRRRPVIRPLSFSVAPGEIVGIIGPGAAGKSTLCKMLVGLLAPGSGSVQLDGVNLHEWLNAGVGRYVGYLPQDIAMVAGSLGDNIGRLEPSSPERSAAIRAAADLVQIYGSLLNLPQGLDTDTEAAGTLLSRSELQKVALARAFYGPPQLIILDEPAAFLDRAGEAALVNALGTLRERGATIVVASQRPQIMKICDRLMLLRDGVIDAYGESAEVLEQLKNGGDEGPDRRTLRLASS